MNEDELRDLVRKAYHEVNNAICDEDSGKGIDTRRLKGLLLELAPALDFPWLTPNVAFPWGRPP